MDLEFKVDLSGYRKGMSAIGRKQLPFATALALTATAGHVGLAEQAEMAAELDRPTPFTLNSVGVKAARKSDLTARVYLKDIAAAYLAPFVDGGPHFLGAKKGLLGPRGVPLNAYGNLSRGKLAALKARKDVFVGPVQLKTGQVVNGVWQRRKAAAGARRKGAAAGAAAGGGIASLKLLIRFADPRPVTQHLDWRGRAERAIAEHFPNAFAKAFAYAMATAK